jgi:hypothetical protein
VAGYDRSSSSSSSRQRGNMCSSTALTPLAVLLCLLLAPGSPSGKPLPCLSPAWSDDFIIM